MGIDSFRPGHHSRDGAGDVLGGVALATVAHLPIDEIEIAVIDVETTGTSNRDRVIEIGVIRATLGGEILDEFDTLVNPARTVTNSTRFHGLSDRDLLDAPVFEDIAGDLVRMLDSSVWVAHNAPFDKRFLVNEYARCGVDVSPFPALCTMQAARRMAAVSTLRRADLQSCCEHFEVEFAGTAHRAIVDARHALGILLSIVRLSGAERLADLGVGIGDEWALPLPVAPVGLRTGGARICRDEVRVRAVAMPAGTDAQGADRQGFGAYYAALEDALSDRRLEHGEIDALLTLAGSVGLTPAQAAEAHALYFSSVAEEAFADHHLSEAEGRDLSHVATMLCLETDDVDRLIAEARVNAAGMELRQAGDASSLAGQSVCFSGALCSTLQSRPITRADAQSLASRAGLVPVNSVTKKTDLLVVSDPHSLSTKTTKARKYGVTVIPEELFWRQAGIAVD